MNLRLSLVTSGLLISLLGLVTPSAVMLCCAIELRLCRLSLLLRS